ncbi:MAG: hypothetical protein EA362_04170 [Saprospirales bacterium]|nr:MAG: hypothetical protein EA362_04170 [Saprospirales bacterium]
MMNPEEIAKKRVKKKKKFYKSISEYTVTTVILLVVNLLTSPRFMWSLIPISIFAVLILIDFFKLYGPLKKDEAWEYKEYQKELKKIKPEEGFNEGKPFDLKELEKEKEKRKNWDERDLV